jgi:hypothetical protein
LVFFVIGFVGFKFFRFVLCFSARAWLLIVGFILCVFVMVPYLVADLGSFRPFSLVSRCFLVVGGWGWSVAREARGAEPFAGWVVLLRLS